MLHKSVHINSECLGFFKYGGRAISKDDKATILILFIYFDPLCTTSAELIEKVIAFSSESALEEIGLILDQMGKGDIPLKRNGASGRFKH